MVMQVQKHVMMQSSPDAGFKPLGDDENKVTEEPGKEGGDSSKEDKSNDQKKDDNVSSTNNVNTASDGNNTNNVNAVSSTINAAGIEVNAVGRKSSIELPDDLNMPELEDIVYSDDDEDVGVEADMNNLDAFMLVSPIPTIRIHKDHPLEQIIRDLHSTPQTRRMTKNLEEHGLFSSVQQRTNHKDFQIACLLAFYYKKNPKRNKKDERGIVIKNKARLVTQGYTQEEWIDYDEVFAPVAKIEAIRLFLAYASFKDFVVYQMDVKSAFLYGKIKEEVYVCQPPGFEDPDFPDRVYKVEKALYGLHQAPKACQDKYVIEILKKFGFTDVKAARTPMETQKPLLKDEDGEEVDVYLYRSMIGSLMYLTSSRPDIILISWQCKKQTMVANSTTEAEYVVASSYCGQVLWIQNQLLDYGDSNENKLIQMIKIHTDNNVADLLTKAFDATVKVKTVNGEVQLQALVDGKKIIITKAIVRRDLQLEDAEGVECLPNATIFEELTRMGAKTTAWNEFSSTMASAIICLATNQKFNFSKYIFKSMVKNLDNAGKFLMYPRPKRKDTEIPQSSVPSDPTNVANEAVNEEPIGRSARVVSSDEASLGDQEDASKQGRKILDIDADEDITMDNVHDDDLMFDTGVLNDEEVFAGHDMAEKEVSTADPVTTTGEVVTTVDVAVSTASTIPVSAATITEDEITLAQALAELKSVKPKVTTATTATTKGILLQEPSELTTTIPSKEKGKGIIDEEPLKMKKKDQISFDEQEAIILQAEFDKEVRLAREKDEANIALTEEWNDIQAKIETDYELAQRLQAEEQEELTVDEKATLFQQLLKKRRNHFAAKKAEEKRNIPPTKAQQRSVKCTYLKNMAGWKPKDLKSKSFANIQELFDKAFKRVNTFVDFRTELVKGTKIEESSKRAEIA
ncbi:putative ribonuclease H-like domain-containing protein [Tanacetum coccineum]|uniref:Ribonuclease H-like domain-containing protein n=1 Tax=Tanacetum coccineum TaxID=301880 RepID=A0ABQ5EY12_9ASTR